jgi:hypothetical protein
MRDGAMSIGTDFPAIRDWLADEQAAILTFAPVRWGILALLAGPGDAEPQAVLLRSFTAGDLNRLLAPEISLESTAWTERIFSSVGALSAGLVQPLRDRLLSAVEHARVLYIVPSSCLYYAPFAALELAAGPHGWPATACGSRRSLQARCCRSDAPAAPA